MSNSAPPWAMETRTALAHAARSVPISPPSRTGPAALARSSKIRSNGDEAADRRSARRPLRSPDGRIPGDVRARGRVSTIEAVEGALQ